MRLVECEYQFEFAAEDRALFQLGTVWRAWRSGQEGRLCQSGPSWAVRRQRCCVGAMCGSQGKQEAQSEEPHRAKGADGEKKN